jgi:ABC-type sugar transport system permease subunit
MINLLPEEEKKELEREKIKNVIFILEILILVFFFFLMSLLLIFQVYFNNQIENQEKILSAKEEELKSFSGFSDFKKAIKETNQELVQVRNFYQDQFFFLPLLEKLSEIVPETIYFRRLTIQRSWLDDEEFSANVVIAGYVQSREDLFLFQKSLREIENFDNVKVSLQSWIESSDVDFYLTFEIK